MKIGVAIKTIENGWLVYYDVVELVGPPEEEMKTGEEERAFTYQFDHEMQGVWNKLVGFLSELFLLPYETYLVGLRKKKEDKS